MTLAKHVSYVVSAALFGCALLINPTFLMGCGSEGGVFQRCGGGDGLEREDVEARLKTLASQERTYRFEGEEGVLILMVTFSPNAHPELAPDKMGSRSQGLINQAHACEPPDYVESIEGDATVSARFEPSDGSEAITTTSNVFADERINLKGHAAGDVTRYELTGYSMLNTQDQAFVLRYRLEADGPDGDFEPVGAYTSGDLEISLGDTSF